MDKQILNFTVNEQILVCENPIKISTNKVNYIQANFDLGTNWSGFDSVRAVWFNDFNCISTVLDSLGNCVVPFEVMKRKGNVKVNLVGSISEDDVLTDRLTSYPVVAVIVDCTAQIVGSNTQPITPSEFEQFAQRVHTDADRAETAASNAETSAQNASDSATSARNSAESAHDDKIAIEQAIAEVIQQIEDFEQVQVVVNTLPPTSPATSDFTDGVLTLGIPQGVKGDTGNGIQSIRKTGTSGLVDTYTITYTDGQTTTFTVTNGAKGDTGNGISTIEKTSTVGLVDTYTITYTDGTTTTFTVTNGEKGDKGDQGEVSLSELEDATVVQTLSDNTPYNYRRTNNGNGSGTREYDEIVGASVGWNQLLTGMESPGESQGITYVWSGGKCTVSGTATANVSIPTISPYPQYTLGHKYFLCGCPKGGTNQTYSLRYSAYGFGENGNGTILNCTNNNASGELKMGSNYPTISIANGTAISNPITFAPQLIDLTLFNSQIADYVYTLEQSTAGSGVTWLKTHFPKLFDNGYQPFDSGSTKSVSGLTAHEMVGKNLWDASQSFGLVDAYQQNGTSIRRKGAELHLPQGAYTFSASKIGSAYAYIYVNKVNDDGSLAHFEYLVANGVPTGFTLNLSDGQYFVIYDAQADRESSQTKFGSYAIQIEAGSTATDYVEYESHTYPLDSSVELRGKYRLDANNQLYADGDIYPPSGQNSVRYSEADLGTLNWTYNGENQFYAPLPQNAKSVTAGHLNVICPRYEPKNVYSTHTSNGICTTTGSVWIVDTNYSTAEALKTSLNNVHLVYELATPTTEQATPYTSPQWCDSHGTEEYVGSELPVGHNTAYPMSLVDTIPTTNGTFEPRVTVTNGVRTVTWVSV